MGRFQFTLRMMLAAVAVVGIGAGLWVAKPSWQLGAIELALMAWVLTSAAILAVHSTGKAKAFWMGVAGQFVMTATCYSSMILLNSTIGSANLPEYLGPLPYWTNALSRNFRIFLFTWAFAPVVGLLCVFTHWLLVRPPEPKA